MQYVEKQDELNRSPSDRPSKELLALRRRYNCIVGEKDLSDKKAREDILEQRMTPTQLPESPEDVTIDPQILSMVEKPFELFQGAGKSIHHDRCIARHVSKGTKLANAFESDRHDLLHKMTTTYVPCMALFAGGGPLAQQPKNVWLEAIH